MKYLGGIGVPELIILFVLWVPLVAALWFWLSFRGRARRFGYPGIRAYLRAAPQTDAEKRDAVNMVFLGLAFCALGILFPPFVLAGLIPLFFGGRKVIYAWLGLGLVNDDRSVG